ncbi:MAG: alpha/beta hydrolase [Dehalococcoidia bacterium]|nr:alpha/beta hydrolase [Dehalococcoidia bacterium]
MPDRSVTFFSEGLTLEGVLHVPDGQGPFPGVVVCHPHPRMGGTMDNNVVVASCWGLRQQRVASLRFNFRGVGGSQGVSEAGDAEVLDALHALECLQGVEEVNTARVGLLGYSFGASIALQAVARGPEVRAVGVIGCPAPRLKEAVASGLLMPKLFIAGDLDQAVPGDQFQALTQQFQDPKEVYQILGGDHFLFGHEREIADLVGGFFSRWLG